MASYERVTASIPAMGLINVAPGSVVMRRILE